MADITLDQNLPASYYTLASGYVIDLAGHDLTWDIDGLSTPVTLENSGGDAKLIPVQGKRIALNAALPANIFPAGDANSPLAESDYEAGLTANASFEFVLLGNTSLGGGRAFLPTAKRSGDIYAILQSSPSTNTAVFSGDTSPDIHVGDIMISLVDNNYQVTVTNISDNGTITFNGSIGSTRTAGTIFALVSGGVVVTCGNLQLEPPITADGTFGVLNVIGTRQYSPTSTKGFHAIESNITADRLGFSPFISGTTIYTHAIGGGCSCDIGELVSVHIVPYGGASRAIIGNVNSPSCVQIGAAYSVSVIYDEGVGRNFRISVGGGIIAGIAGNADGIGVQLSVSDTKTNLSSPFGKKSAFCYFGCTIFSSGAAILDKWTEQAGTVTRIPGNRAWLHAPATAGDVTWRYEDHLVPPSATLRLRCAWHCEGTAATRASVALTDTATWWPQLWPLSAEAMASVEFDELEAEKELTWTNDGEDEVQVRVWECVTGSAGGGYLSAREPDESDSESQSSSGSKSESGSGSGGGGDPKGIVGRALANAQDGISSYTHGNRSISRNSPESTLNFADRYEERQKRKKGRMPWMNVGF